MKLKVVEPHELAEFAAARNLIHVAPPHGVVKDVLPSVEVHSPQGSTRLAPMEVENRAGIVLRLPEATIAGSLGVVYDGFLLPGGVSHSMGWLQSYRRDGGWCELPQRERLDAGDGLCMLGVLSHWGHFFVDVLDRLLQLRRLGWLDRRLVADAGPPCVNAMALARKAGMAIEENAVLRASHQREYRVRDFLLPTLESSKPAISARSYRELRDLVVPAGAGNDGAALFVGRADVRVRFVVNQKALIADLEASGQGKAIFPEHLTIDQAIAQFCAARAVILPVGSAKFNLIFCRPGTPVVCVTPAGYAEENAGVTPMIRHMCHALGLKLCFYSSPIERHSQVLLHSNLLIDRGDLRRMLEELV